MHLYQKNLSILQQKCTATIPAMLGNSNFCH